MVFILYVLIYYIFNILILGIIHGFKTKKTYSNLNSDSKRTPYNTFINSEIYRPLLSPIHDEAVDNEIDEISNLNEITNQV